MDQFVYSMSREAGCLGIKSAVVWRHKDNGAKTYPVAYVRKPKHATDAEFSTVLDLLGFEKEGK